ncbi:MAG: hypothetical protein LQ352_003379 [Teloschistes flavicans]|nr:MAG: hypothetical protein LQ352_003379 [Teloschistes flavicans]
MIETLSPREEQPRNQEATQEQRLTRLSSLLWTQYSVQPTEAERRRVEQQYQHLILDGRPGFLAFLSSTQILLWKIYDETVSKIETTSANWAQSEINANYIPGISDRSVGVSTGWTILFLEMMKGSGFMPYQSLVQRIEQGDNWALIWNIIKDAPSFRRNKQRLSYLLAHEYMQEIIRCRRLIDPGDIQTASWKGRTERAVAQLQERLDRMSRRSFTQRQGLNTTTTTRRL